MRPTSIIVASVLAGTLSTAGLADPIADPPMLASKGGRLDVLMVARPQRLPLQGAPAGYVYEVCERSPEAPNARRCVAQGSGTDVNACPTRGFECVYS